MLAALGADVIHVESIAHPDPMRYAAAVMFLDRDRWWELSSFYLCINTNKRGITLDLGTPEGVALAERLVGWADVVVENYTPRVMPKFGLGWDRIHELNPQAVMVRQPAFGLDGPWTERLGFAQNMEQMCRHGLPHRSRRPGAARPPGPVRPARRRPRRLRHPRRPRPAGPHRGGLAGRGALIEGALNVTAEPVVEYTATGRIMGRDGNRSAHAAPQGLYPCAGDGASGWPLLGGRPTSSGQALAGVLGDAGAGRTTPSWPTWPGVAATTTGSTRRSPPGPPVVPSARRWPTCSAAGVPAATLADPRTSTYTRSTGRAGTCEDTPHAVLGSLPVFGMPFRMTGRDRWNERPAPVVGEHNGEVLGGLLGLDDARLASLTAAGVIGDRPAGT